MENFQNFDPAILNDAGLLRQAVFNIADLPPDVAASLHDSGEQPQPWKQLILIGHAGRKMWEAVKASGMESQDPIDDFTVRTVQQWFAARQPNNRYDIVYPGTRPVGLQSLGSFTTSFKRIYGKTPTEHRESFPPAAALAIVPACVVRAYGRPQNRTFREDRAETPT